MVGWVEPALSSPLRRESRLVMQPDRYIGQGTQGARWANIQGWSGRLQSNFRWICGQSWSQLIHSILYMMSSHNNQILSYMCPGLSAYARGKQLKILSFALKHNFLFLTSSRKYFCDLVRCFAGSAHRQRWLLIHTISFSLSALWQNRIYCISQHAVLPVILFFLVSWSSSDSLVVHCDSIQLELG